MQLSEDEKLKIIQRIIKKLARKYRFGYHTVQDMEQEAFCLAWEAMPRYDPTRNFYNFMYTHIKNRLQTFMRDNYMKPCPCKECYGRSDGETRHEDKKHCEQYNLWYAANKRRGNIMSAIGLSCVDEEGESRTFYPDTVCDTLEKKEIFKKIDEELPAEYRSSYLRMKEGASGVSASEREEVLAKIREILNLDVQS